MKELSAKKHSAWLYPDKAISIFTTYIFDAAYRLFEGGLRKKKCYVRSLKSEEKTAKEKRKEIGLSQENTKNYFKQSALK
ncbi:CLUMA_CG014776, isoform A [Clunio marinus]|uniref:CLUMA_CG014776, isoform A n=1 Tax=Clunio marinus TaxID=568069 RepID=A0A1J1ILL4_9DIPT|nr:CLUMA_CG014776, isoform A [Clunio marinus]